MRWRDVKQNKIKPQTTTQNTPKSASVSLRIKAFIIDMFMINMPILYITTYIILDGKESFQQNPLAIFVCTAIFGLIVSFLLSKFSQTPGYKAQEIKLKNFKTRENVGLLRALWRFLCFVLAGSSVIGLFVCFFRADGRGLHDILSDTVVIEG